jgi:hypothetical protein
MSPEMRPAWPYVLCHHRRLSAKRSEIKCRSSAVRIPQQRLADGLFYYWEHARRSRVATQSDSEHHLFYHRWYSGPRCLHESSEGGTRTRLASKDLQSQTVWNAPRKGARFKTRPPTKPILRLGYCSCFVTLRRRGVRVCLAYCQAYDSRSTIFL